MGLQSNQFYELHLYLATRNLLLRSGCAKGLLLSQKRCSNGRPLAEKPQPASTRITALIRHVAVCVCLCTSQSAACYCCSCPSVWRLKNMFTVNVLFFFLHCSCYSTFSIFFFDSRLFFCRFVLFKSQRIFSSWHNLFNLTCQMERSPNFAIWRRIHRKQHEKKEKGKEKVAYQL